MKSGIISTAAAVILSATAAGAADLNKPAKVAVDYVKVCDAYGAGFFYIPGSDTCLRITGYVYTGYEYGVSNTMSNAAANGVGGLANIKGTTFAGGLVGGQRGKNQTDTYVRADVQTDARTNTQYGLLRQWVNFHVDFNTSNSNSAVTTVRLDDAIVQFGGLTAGRTWSLFQAVKSHYVIQQNWGDNYTQARTNQLGYTFSFGNGVTATIDVEDPTTTGYLATNNGSDDYARHNGLSFTYGALNAPDILANLKVAQAWGAAEIDGMAHQLYGGPTTPVTGWGFGIQGNVRVNTPTLGTGDSFMLNANYISGGVAMSMWQAPEFKPSGAGFTDLGADATYSAATGIKQTKTWSADVAFEHNFNPNFKIDASAGYGYVNGYAQTTGLGALANGGYGGNSFGYSEESINFYWMPIAKIPSTFIVPYVEARQITYTSQTKANYAAASLTNGSAINFGVRVNSGF